MTPTEAIDLLYRQAVKTAHPDHGGDTSTFTRVREAVNVLRAVPPKTAPPPRRPQRVTYPPEYLKKVAPCNRYHCPDPNKHHPGEVVWD